MFECSRVLLFSSKDRVLLPHKQFYKSFAFYYSFLNNLPNTFVHSSFSPLFLLFQRLLWTNKQTSMHVHQFFETLDSKALINIFGGAISGYNTGIVAGLTYPLIKCTLFDYLTDNEVAFYQVLVLGSCSLHLGIIQFYYIDICNDIISNFNHDCKKDWLEISILLHYDSLAIAIVHSGYSWVHLSHFHDSIQQLLVYASLSWYSGYMLVSFLELPSRNCNWIHLGIMSTLHEHHGYSRCEGKNCNNSSDRYMYFHLYCCIFFSFIFDESCLASDESLLYSYLQQ